MERYTCTYRTFTHFGLCAFLAALGYALFTLPVESAQRSGANFFFACFLAVWLYFVSLMVCFRIEMVGDQLTRTSLFGVKSTVQVTSDTTISVPRSRDTYGKGYGGPSLGSYANLYFEDGSGWFILSTLSNFEPLLTQIRTIKMDKRHAESPHVPNPKIVGD